MKIKRNITVALLLAISPGIGECVFADENYSDISHKIEMKTIDNTIKQANDMTKKLDLETRNMQEIEIEPFTYNTSINSDDIYQKLIDISKLSYLSEEVKNKVIKSLKDLSLARDKYYEAVEKISGEEKSKNYSTFEYLDSGDMEKNDTIVYNYESDNEIVLD